MITQWESLGGTRRLEGERIIQGRLHYAVRTGDSRTVEFHTEDSLASEQRRDAANLESRARAEARRRKEEEAERQRLDTPLERFLASLPAMQGGRARKSLSILLRLDGRVETRSRHLEQLVANGYRADGERLVHPDKAGFYGRDDFTKAGLAYAEFLAR